MASEAAGILYAAVTEAKTRIRIALVQEMEAGFTQEESRVASPR